MAACLCRYFFYDYMPWPFQLVFDLVPPVTGAVILGIAFITACKRTRLAALVWAAIVVCHFLFFYYVLWIYDIAIMLALLVAGATILVIALIKMIRKSTRFRDGRASCVIVLAVFVLGWLTPLGSGLGLYFRLWREEADYLRQVQLASTEIGRATLKHPTKVDLGPPIRVAFQWSGFGDNWSGIVYDPSGEVLKSNQFALDYSNFYDPSLADVKRLFGGDMRGARHLWGNWYFCSFT
jgi:hypothetical protein